MMGREAPEREAGTVTDIISQIFPTTSSSPSIYQITSNYCFMLNLIITFTHLARFLLTILTLWTIFPSPYCTTLLSRSMNLELEQIKLSFESLGMLPEQIAEDRNLDIVAVKAALLQSSSVYRSLIQSEEVKSRLDFSDSDLLDANEMIVHNMKYAEDEHLRQRAAEYVRDDRKGRKELKGALGGNTFNILQFNENLRSIRDKTSRIKERFLQDAIPT